MLRWGKPHPTYITGGGMGKRTQGVNWVSGRGMEAGAGFFLPLNDLGAGQVNIGLARGVGSGTFTRATTAWTKLASGLWTSVASGVARSMYFGQNTVAGTDYCGYVSELAGTQLVTPTAAIRDMTDASWVKVTMTAAKTATGIDGVTNSATTITATGATATIQQTLVAAATTRTYSCFIKRRTGTGTVLIVQGATTLDVTASINSSTYTRVQLPASVLNVAFGIQINTSGDAIDVDFNQFESGGTATTPMDAAGAARNADNLRYDFSGNADATKGTAYSELTSFYPATNTSGANINALALGNSAIGRPFILANTQAVTAIVCTDSTNTASKTGLTSLFTGVRKRASSWGESGMAVTGDGAAPATNSFDGSMGATLTNIWIGSSGGSEQWGGTIRNLRLWKTQMPNAFLQAITS